MNLGQAFGIDLLRILQLEDELERQGRPVPVPVVARPIANDVEPAPALVRIQQARELATRSGLRRRVFEYLQLCEAPRSTDEIADALECSKHQLFIILPTLVRAEVLTREGPRRHYRYWVPADKRKAAA